MLKKNRKTSSNNSVYATVNRFVKGGVKITDFDPCCCSIGKSQKIVIVQKKKIGERPAPVRGGVVNIVELSVCAEYRPDGDVDELIVVFGSIAKVDKAVKRCRLREKGI